MSKLIILMMIAAFAYESSIYSFHVPAINGDSIVFSQYQGKQIFLVNIATGSQANAQLGELEQLYQMHKSNMIVIGFPSNSFGNEPLSNEHVENLLRNTYHVTFPLAAKGIVLGDSAQPLYRWLADKTENGVLKARIRGDYQKILLNSQGRIVGVFDSTTNPLHARIQAAIQNNP